MTAAVSIIIPIYNVEKYLRKCLDSVVNQTLRDVEIICVNDGSLDNCGAIIEEYAAKDKRIIAIHQKNGGYGKAVNKGFEVAKGEYLGIIESDDFCELDMFEKLYNQAKKFDVDVCKCDFKYYHGKNNFKSCKNIKTVTSENRVFTIKEVPEIFKHHVSIWSAIYKRKYILTNNIKVEESKSASYQDMPFAALVYAKGAKITILHEHLINYRFEEDMVSSTMRADGRLKMMPIQCGIAKKYFIENNCWDEVKETAYWHFYNCSVGMFLQTDMEYKKAHFDELVKLFSDIKNDNIDMSIFNKRKKKVIGYIINRQYEELMRYVKYSNIIDFIRKLRKKVVSIRWNKNERIITLFGRKLVDA